MKNSDLRPRVKVSLADLSKMMKAHVDDVMSRPFNPVKSDRDKFCCMSYWYPKILKNNVRTPKTTLIQLDFKQSFDLFKFIEGETTEISTQLFKDIYVAIKDLDGFRCFLRTGQTSGKHSWNHACNLFIGNSSDRIAEHVGALVDFSGCVDLPVDVWAVREMLTTRPLFFAFDGMPIVRERRYFVMDGKVEEHFPYWPQHSIEGQVVPYQPVDWKKVLAQDNKQSREEVKLLTKLSEEATRDIEGYWSIDWLYTVDGWYCTDMALGAASYHYGKDPKNKG